jgi:hypothetical protein
VAIDNSPARRRNLINDLRLIQAVQMQAVRLARQQNNQGTAHEVEPLDLEDREYLDNLSAEVVSDSYQLLLGETHDESGPRSKGKADSGGLRQTEADRDVHGFLVSGLREIYMGSLVCGEESTDLEWNVWSGPQRLGQIGFQIDAIDGSSLHDCLGWGFSSNLIMYVMTEAGWQPVMVSIVTSSGDAVAMLCDTDTVYIRDLLDPDSVEELLSEPKVQTGHVRRGFVAAVAALPPARRRAATLLDTTIGWGLPPQRFGSEEEHDPPLTVTTAGGAPATYGMAALRLEGLITTEASTVHDACGILALVALGIPAYWIHGQEGIPAPITLPELKELFTQPPRPGLLYKRVPPHVVCRDEDRAVLIAERLNSVGPQEVRGYHVSGRGPLRLVEPQPEESPEDVTEPTDEHQKFGIDKAEEDDI